MCEPYSRLGSHYSQVSILSHGLSHERLNKVKNTSVNFITPHLKSKEHSPRNHNEVQRVSRDLMRISSDGHKNTPVGAKQVTRSLASQVTEFCSAKDICLQAELDDNYSSLTTHVMRKLPSGNDFVALRSINVALNNLLKVPEGLTKNLQILNLSRNRIKSLAGIELCSKLVFLNASHNQIQTVSTIGVLQRLKELYLNNNWLPTASLKEFAQIKSLCILDLA